MNVTEVRDKPLCTNTGCLPFTWSNRSLHGLGEMVRKVDKFRPGIAFKICTNQFNLPKNEALKLVSKVALKKWNTNFRLEYSIRKNRTTFSDVPLFPRIFRWEADPKSRVPFTSVPTGFAGKSL